MSALADAAENGSGSASGERGFAWSQLVARLLHPIKVQIIETMLWVDRPLSANELSKIYSHSPGLGLCSYHVRSLVKWGVLEEVAKKQRRGAEETFLTISSMFSLYSPAPLEGSESTETSATSAEAA